MTGARVFTERIAAIDPDRIRSLYEVGLLSASEIATYLGISKATVYRLMERHGIKVRSKHDAGRIARSGNTFDDAQAARLYEAGYSVNDIVPILKCSRNTLFLSLHKNGVKVRSKSEAGTLRRNSSQRRSPHARCLVGIEKCAICGLTDRLERHHIDADASNDDTDNLIWFCWEHHVFLEWLITKALDGLRRAELSSSLRC